MLECSKNVINLSNYLQVYSSFNILNIFLLSLSLYVFFFLSNVSQPTFLGYFTLASLTKSSALSSDTRRSWEKDGVTQVRSEGWQMQMEEERQKTLKIMLWVCVGVCAYHDIEVSILVSCFWGEQRGEVQQLLQQFGRFVGMLRISTELALSVHAQQGVYLTLITCGETRKDHNTDNRARQNVEHVELTGANIISWTEEHQSASPSWSRIFFHRDLTSRLA